LAVLWQSALAHLHNVKLLPGCYWALGLAVWVVYLLDRTLNGFSAGDSDSLGSRQRFYRKYRHLFAWAVIPSAIAALVYVALTDIPSGLMWRGLALGFLVCMYLLHYPAKSHKWIYYLGNLAAGPTGLIIIWILPAHPYRILWLSILAGLLVLSFARQFISSFRMPPKELLSGYLFAAGCSLSVNFFTLDLQAGPFMAVETILLAVLCVLNGIAIACYERNLANRNPDTITQTWPQIVQVYPMLLATLAGAAIMALIREPSGQMQWYIGAILLSTALLGIVHAMAKRLSPDLAHVLADVALVTPVIWLALS
jgi:hypothetical protein